MMQPGRKNLYIGVSFAITAAIIWSVNFVIARGISGKIAPFSLNFFRWVTASVILFPFALKRFKAEKNRVMGNWKYFFAVSFTCILLFNTFVYIAGHHTTAINLALIGTTSAPVFTILLSAIFLKETIKPLRVLGLITCFAGILYLLCQGSFQHLLAFRFSRGDWWILSGAFFFAVYTILVKRRPPGISSLVFLFVFVLLGTLMLLPFFIWELQHTPAIEWNAQIAGIVLYLGLGTSIIAYLCWNAAILRIGSSRTSLFGNLIPIFSTFEALWILNEQMTSIHIISGVLVITGLVIANLRKASAP